MVQKNAEKLFNILIKEVNNGKLTKLDEVYTRVFNLCNKLGIILTQEQRDAFVKAFCDKYLPEQEEIENLEDIIEEPSDVDDLDDFLETPEDEIKKLLNKIEYYKAKLLENPKNKISIQSMISKLRKKLRDLGYEFETTSKTKVDKKSIESLKAKLEQLELDLALSPIQKRKSVQSMISKIKKQLRDLGDITYIKVPKEKVIKLTPAEKIGLNEKNFNAFINASCLAVDDSEPFNKLIIASIVKYAKKNNIDLQELAKFVLKFMKNKFTDFCFPIHTYKFIPNIASIIENQTLKNLVKLQKSKASLTFTDLYNIDNLFKQYKVDVTDEKLLKKIAKCQSINEVKLIVNSNI